MSALRSVAHELTHVNERSRCRVIIRLGVGCSKVSWFGRGQSQGDECQGDTWVQHGTRAPQQAASLFGHTLKRDRQYELSPVEIPAMADGSPQLF